MQVEHVGLHYYAAYQKLNPITRLNLVDSFGRTEEDQRKIDTGVVLVLVVFPCKAEQLPFLAIATKDLAVAERVSTARIVLAWRTANQELKDCELYVAGQSLYRDVGTGCVRLFASLETVRYEEQSVHSREFRLVEQFHRLDSVAMTQGSLEDRTMLGKVTVNTKNARGPLRFVRLELHF